MTDFKERFGLWALVTGASSGIGAEFARQLAIKGLNLVLVARRRERMEQLAKRLHDLYGTECDIIDMDLSCDGAVADIDERTGNRDVGLVVACAGMETDGGFLKSAEEDQERLIRLNCTVPMQLAHRFGGRLVARGRGGILLVSSTFGYQAVPYFANYAASKSYVLLLGEALHHEFGRNGVDVTVLSPGLTDTEMPAQIDIDFSKLPMKLMQPEEVVRAALNGLQRHRMSVIPGIGNRIMAFMVQRLMRRSSVAAMFGEMNRKAMPEDNL